MSSYGDNTAQLCERVQAAYRENTPLFITGAGSKRDVLGRNCNATPLEIGAHCGIVDYEPGELVMTARAGTPLAEIMDALQAEGQELAFEPPLCGGAATLGGTLAANLSGPGRPWRGSARDVVLGIQLISGTGELLNFGGRVMKNVAGYDLSRLQAGALGTLGVISTASLKVLPRAESTVTLRQELPADEALDIMQQRAATPRPLTGACWTAGALYLRLAGAASAVSHTATLWGGEQLAPQDADTFWRDLGELQLPALSTDKPLWRLSIKPSAPLTFKNTEQVIDWCGAQRWIATDVSADELYRYAAQAGGHAQLFRGGDRNAEVRSPLTPVQQRVQQSLKTKFDPGNILNPGRLYTWL